MNKKRILLRFLVMLFILTIPSANIMAASGLKLNYDGKTVAYSGKQVKYQLDGKSISLKKTPGIIINGYALASYKEVFATALGAACKYDSNKNTISISKFGTTIKMTVGSRTAYINGKKATLPIAPKKVKYIAANTTKILVPSRFVAEALGYEYTWYSSKSLVTIKSPYQIYYDKEWHLYNGSKGKVTIDGQSVNVTKNPSVVLDQTTLLDGQKVFTQEPIQADYKYDSSSKKITIKKGDTTIIFILGKKTASVNGKSYPLSAYPRIIKNNVSNSNSVMIPGEFTATMLGYNYLWNTATKTSEITTRQENPDLDGDDSVPEDETVIEQWDAENVNIIDGFSNLLSTVRYSRKGTNEIITFAGSIELNSVVGIDELNPNIINIDFPGVQNTIGDISYTPENNDGIIRISLMTMENYTTRLQVEKTDNYNYYTEASGNEFSLYLTRVVTDEYALKIPVADTITLDMVTDEDLYYSNQFILTLPGDLVSHFNNNPIAIQKDMITDVQYALNQNGDTTLTITTGKLQGYKLAAEEGYIGVVVDDPQNIYSNIVVLDPGHGGTDPGAGKSGIKEKDLNFSILYSYARTYFNARNSNVKAYWTRTTDTFVELTDRPKLIAQTGADLFISLHMNSYDTAAPNGTETYYCTSNNSAAFSGLTSKAMATYFQNGLISALNLNSRGVKSANYVVIKQSTVPAILIELGFVTNSSDFNQLKNPAFQEKAAKSIYNLTSELFDIYPTGR